MSISKNVLIGCLCFFIVFWHVFKTEQGTVRVRFLHSSLHIDWQGKKRVTRLNSLHASLGAWKDSTLCIIPLGHEKQKTTLCHRDSGPVGFLGFLGFRVFFLFFSFFCILQFFWFSDLSLRSISSSGLRCVCFHMSAWRNPWSTRKLDSWEGPLWTKKSKLFRFFRLAGVQTNF